MTHRRGGNGGEGDGTQSWSALHEPRAGTAAGVHARATSDHATGGNVGLPPLGVHVEAPLAMGPSILNDAPQEGVATQVDEVSGCALPHGVAQLLSEKNMRVGGMHTLPWGVPHVHAEQVAAGGSIPRLPSNADVPE